MMSNTDQIRTVCTYFTYIIKVSNSMGNNPLFCISKNEVNEKKKGVSYETSPGATKQPTRHKPAPCYSLTRAV